MNPKVGKHWQIKGTFVKCYNCSRTIFFKTGSAVCVDTLKYFKELSALKKLIQTDQLQIVNCFLKENTKKIYTRCDSYFFLCWLLMCVCIVILSNFCLCLFLFCVCVIFLQCVYDILLPTFCLCIFSFVVSFFALKTFSQDF